MLFCHLLFFVLFILYDVTTSSVCSILPIKHQISDRFLFKFSYPYSLPMFPSSQVNIPFSSELSDNPENGNNSPGSVDNSFCPSNVPEPQPLRRSSRVGKPPDRLNL